MQQRVEVSRARVASGVRPSRHATLAKQFTSMCPCIIDWRWGLLTFAMGYVLARKTALQTLSAQKFVKSAKGKNPQYQTRRTVE